MPAILTKPILGVACMAGQGRGSGLASASLADDPQAQELLGRVNKLVLRKLASPGGACAGDQPSAISGGTR